MHLLWLGGVHHWRGDNPLITGDMLRCARWMLKLSVDGLGFGRYHGSRGRWHPRGSIEGSVHCVLNIVRVEFTAQHFRELLRGIGEVVGSILTNEGSVALNGIRGAGEGEREGGEMREEGRWEGRRRGGVQEMLCMSGRSCVAMTHCLTDMTCTVP